MLSSLTANALTSAAFEDDFGTFSLDMFRDNPNLTTIAYYEGASGWPQTFNNGTADITMTSTVCAALTPVPAGPIWLLGIMAGLLSLLDMSKLRKA